MDRNFLVRDRYNSIIEEFGVKHKWVSERTDIIYSTLINWKSGRMLISDDKLDKIEELLKRYDNINFD